MPLIVETLILCAIFYLLGIGAAFLASRRLARRRRRRNYLEE